MHWSRRDFLKYCGMSAAALGLSRTDLFRLEQAVAAPPGPGVPTVLWLQGAGCTGCSMSFLNFVSTTGGVTTTAADILLTKINLAYHPNIMAAAGQDAVEVAKAAYDQGGYILAVEGGVPTGYKGGACYAWTFNGVDVTFQQVVKDLAGRADKILCIGNCAAWGCVPAAKPNPAKIVGVGKATGKPTINIAGCPAHPDWVVGTIAQLLAGNDIPLDSNGRPAAIYSRTVHSQCPRRNTPNICLSSRGCRGPATYANCPTIQWNNNTNWCVGADAPCTGCTEPGFPGTKPLKTVMFNPHGGTNRNCGPCHEKNDVGGGGGGQGPHSAAFIEANQGNCNSCH